MFWLPDRPRSPVGAIPVEQFYNTHVLRHSMATPLQKSGVSIKEIADLLRHRDVNTAKVYARVDLERLQTVALA